MDALFPYDHHGRERALSAAVQLSPRALFEAALRREIADLHARGVPDPGGERASESAAIEMFGHAFTHVHDIKDKLRECQHAHSVGAYVALAEHDVYAAFASYIGCIEEAGNPHRHHHHHQLSAHKSSYSSSSALAAFHRAMPVEQRDDEWHAVDAVLRARELHHHAREERRLYNK